jgi:hypothetical protein
MVQDSELLKRIYNAFDPFRPLEADDPAYVNCQKVRGDGDILIQLGQAIVLSDQVTCQLYAGHRGAGKSTELKRLKKFLESNQFYVVYFAADEEDIDPEDAQHTDILLACTRHLLEALKDSASPQRLVNWLKDRLQSLKDLALTEVSVEDVTVEGQISQFGKISAVLKAAPSTRQKIRQEVETHTPSLIDALNEFIIEAKCKLASKYSELVVIADNLDRIVPIFDEEGKRSNHDQIFVDRSEQLRKLKCHMIYTVPISMVYSDRATDLEDRFGTIQALPMIMVCTPDGKDYEPGLEKLKELIAKRISKLDANLPLEQVFQDDKVLKNLCLMSGGHVRNLMLLMKNAVQSTPKLPISSSAVQRAIAESRKPYRRAINDNEWSTLAKVYLSKEKPNNNEHRKLLLNRCILEYHSVIGSDIKPWHDIHPLIFDIEEFQKAMNREK